MNGDLFSSNYDYERLVMSTSEDFLLSSIAITKTRTCKRKNGIIYEAFKDDKSFQARLAGPIYCATMNGRLASFPETYDELSSLLEYKRNFMFQTNQGFMAAAVNAKSYSVVPEKPDIGYPPNGYFDIYEIGTERLLNPDDKVKRSISKDHHSYQSKSELCYVMRSWGDDTKPPEGFDAEHTWFLTQRCERYMTYWWVVCAFDSKIFLKVSGLCEFSPVDKLFTLMDPDKEDGKEGTRYGTFSGWLNIILDHC